MLSPMLLTKPFSPGLLGTAQPSHSPGVGGLPVEGLHLSLVPSWVQVME